MLKKIVSFGYKRAEPPHNVRIAVVDVRQLFRNPYGDRTLRHLTGKDPEVQKEVLRTPNFAAKYQHIKEFVSAPGMDEAWIGCHGGRHRSVYLAERLGAELGVPVEHRDLETTPIDKRPSEGA